MTEQLAFFGPDPGAQHPLIGRKVRLDPACKCGGDVGVIAAGKAMHAATVRCYGCERFVQWLSHHDYQQFAKLITEIGNSFGAPPEIIYRIPHQTNQGGEMATEFDNTNRGALFKNNDKTEDKHADYRGTINVAGTEYWLNAWIKVSKKGTKFMSLSVKPKEETSKEKSKPDFDDSIPF